ncbi:cadherin-like beta sandwich domain-containing protein [Brevibacillus fluminis]|uniref:cadherin-like beta sandwich domain-containing protein n=1 Tax=Brevibacillus fluminis TaxID=511487 RepID=UPI003F8A3E7C
MRKKVKRIVMSLILLVATVLQPGLLPGWGERVYAASGDISTYAGTGTAGYSGDNGPATSAQLNTPTRVAVDSSGNLYIAVRANNAIRKIDTSGKITTVAGTGAAGYGGDGGPATSAQLNFPDGVEVDKDGNIYIADSFNHRVRKVDTTGKITTVAGTGTAGYGGDGGPATEAQLKDPTGVAVDNDGNLYIADYENHRIRKVDTTGKITTVAGTGTRGFSGDGGAAASAELNYPGDVAVDSVGNLYISDQENRRIRKVDTSGMISTVAGGGVSTDEGVPATSAQLKMPVGVSVDSRGNLYIGDNIDRKIRRVEPTGKITTLAGNGSYGFSGDGGPAISAQLSTPYDAVADSSGNIYIGDANNHRIRKVTALSRNANMSNLALSQGMLSPLFTPSETNYTASVANDVSSITITPTVSDSSATVTVNGTAVTSGTASGAINLTVGSNTITIVVTAQDGTTNTYTIIVTRAALSSNADLSNLILSQGTLSPAFDPGTLIYTASVANSVSSITVTPIVSDSNATVTVNSASVTSGTASGAINLAVDNNAITVVVTAQDGTTNTYTIIVTRAALSSNADLSNLVLSQGTLSPAFTPARTDYTSSVANSISSITVTPTASDSTATMQVRVNGGTYTPVMSGSPSGALNLNEGANTVDVRVTAQDQTTANTYRINITRAQYRPPYYPVTGISLDRTHLVLTMGGKTERLQESIQPRYATYQQVTWSSSNPDVASVGENGVVTPLSPGTATITVTTTDQAKTAECQVEVVEPIELVGLNVSEKTVLLKPNQSSRFTLYALYSNGTKEDITREKEVTYRSSPSTKATVKRGRIIAGEKEGKATITFTYRNKSVKIPVIISKTGVTKLELQPINLPIEVDQDKQLRLTATLSNKDTQDVTDLATWSTSNPAIAAVDENGKLTAIAPGTAIITATYGGRKTDTSIEVSEAKVVKRLSVNKRTISISAGKGQQVKLTAYYQDHSKQIVTELAEWSSEDETIASVKNGVIVGKTEGTVEILAKYRGKKVTITVTVTK